MQKAEIKKSRYPSVIREAKQLWGRQASRLPLFQTAGLTNKKNLGNTIRAGFLSIPLPYRRLRVFRQKFDYIFMNDPVSVNGLVSVGRKDVFGVIVADALEN